VLSSATVSTIIVLDLLEASTLTVSTLNGVPYGQGYTDTTTWQYNYIDEFGQFQPGIFISTPTTVGYSVVRPNAPINYMNVVFSGLYLSEFNLAISTLTSNVSTTVINQEGDRPQFVEVSTSFTVVSPELLNVHIDPNLNILRLYSFSLGYN
jgi:hypothetical protein